MKTKETILKHTLPLIAALVFAPLQRRPMYATPQNNFLAITIRKLKTTTAPAAI